MSTPNPVKVFSTRKPGERNIYASVGGFFAALYDGGEDWPPLSAVEAIRLILRPMLRRDIVVTTEERRMVLDKLSVPAYKLDWRSNLNQPDTQIKHNTSVFISPADQMLLAVRTVLAQGNGSITRADGRPVWCYSRKCVAHTHPLLPAEKKQLSLLLDLGWLCWQGDDIAFTPKGRTALYTPYHAAYVRDDYLGS